MPSNQVAAVILHHLEKGVQRFSALEQKEEVQGQIVGLGNRETS